MRALPWMPLRSPRPRSRAPLELEPLEDRIVLDGSPLSMAQEVELTVGDPVALLGSIDPGSEFDLFKVSLEQEERLLVDLDVVELRFDGTDPNPLTVGRVRIFDSLGNQQDLSQSPLDPVVTFSPGESGDYFIGVSHFLNAAYDPKDADSGIAAGAGGAYRLNLRLSNGPDLTSRLQVIQSSVALGEELLVNIEVANRGLFPSIATTLDLRISVDSTITEEDPLVRSLNIPAIAPNGFRHPIDGASISVRIPDIPELEGVEELFLGIIVDPDNQVVEENESNNSNQGPDVVKIFAQGAFTESESNDQRTEANPIFKNSSVKGSLSSYHDVDFYAISVLEEGELRASLSGSNGARLRLDLFAPDGRLLGTSVTSENGEGAVDAILLQQIRALSSEGAAPLFQASEPQTWFLAVSSAWSDECSGAEGGCEYKLSTAFTPADPVTLILTETGPGLPVEGDFDEDGNLDLAFANFLDDTVSVSLGLGNGSFRAAQTYRVGNGPSSLLMEDFDLDGDLDLATVNLFSSDITILNGLGNGSFSSIVQPPVAPLLPGTFKGATGDLNGDRIPDIAAVSSQAVTLFLGTGNGFVFIGGLPLPAGAVPADLLVDDFNADGRPDIATANTGTSSVSVFLNFLQFGAFPALPPLAVAGSPMALAAGDFNEDGNRDLATANSANHTVAILLGNGNGIFDAESPPTFSVDEAPLSITAEDIDQDGHLDLITTNLAVSNEEGLVRTSGNFSVLKGNGDATFDPQERLSFGIPLGGALFRDLNRDGRSDMIAPFGEGAIAFPGLGNGSFPNRVTAVGRQPKAIAEGDFNNDTLTDLVIVNHDSNDISILLGTGSVSFQTELRIPVGENPIDVAVADINRDGRADIAVVHEGSNTVSVLLNLGNGQFLNTAPLATGGSGASSIAVGDVNNDRRLDLVVSNRGSGNVSVIFGQPGSTFSAPVLIATGNGPVAVELVDVTGDRELDLIVLDADLGQVQALSGNGNGTFGPIRTFAVGSMPLEMVIRDLNDDGLLDIVVSNSGGNNLSILLGTGDANLFSAEERFEIGRQPGPLLVADLDGDLIVDLVIGSTTDAPDRFTFAKGDGDGTFDLNGVPLLFPGASSDLLAVELSGDGLPELVVLDASSDQVLIGLNSGEGKIQIGVTTFEPSRAEPILADINRDNLDDLLIVDRRGRIIFRQGREVPDSPFRFAPPLIVNPDNPARAATVARAGGETLIAAIDQNTASISLYRHSGNGSFQRLEAVLPTGALPTDLDAIDLNNDSLDELVVSSLISSDLRVFEQTSPGIFALFGEPLAVGMDPVDVLIADVGGSVLSDVVVLSSLSADVTYLQNLSNGTIEIDDPARFRAGGGPYRSALRLNDPEPLIDMLSEDGSIQVIADHFDGDDRLDLIVVNAGLRNLALLRGQPGGGFANPEIQLIDFRPRAIASGDFDANGHADLAVLHEDGSTIEIFLWNEGGSFESIGELSVGVLASGLAIQEVTGDEHLDLLIGTEFGDVLTVPGIGPGTFDLFQRVGKNVTLAVADLDGDNEDDFVFANESLDRLTVVLSTTGAQILEDRENGLLSPDAVMMIDLNNDQHRDMVVVNRASNSIFAYLGDGSGGLGQRQTFFVGSSPAHVTTALINDDAIPDVVVTNELSNDVSVLFGEITNGSWTLRSGPRLSSGGLGPVETTVRDVTGPFGGPDGIADLLITNRLSSTVTTLQGLGQGFFDDQNPTVRAVEVGPVSSAVGNFNGSPGIDILTLSTATSSLTLFSNAIGTSTTMSTGGEAPVAMLTGDFTGDGLDDVIVAHNGDGTLSFFRGMEDGLELFDSVVVENGLLTGLVLASSTPERLELYVTREGEEAATLIGFSFETDFAFAALAGIDVLDFLELTAVLELTFPEGSDLAVVATVLLGAALDAIEEPSSSLSDETGDDPDLQFSLADPFLVERFQNQFTEGGGEEREAFAIEEWIQQILNQLEGIVGVFSSWEARLQRLSSMFTGIAQRVSLPLIDVLKEALSLRLSQETIVNQYLDLPASISELLLAWGRFASMSGILSSPEPREESGASNASLEQSSPTVKVAFEKKDNETMAVVEPVEESRALEMWSVFSGVVVALLIAGYPVSVRRSQASKERS